MKFLMQRFSMNAIAFAATALLAACGGGDATAPLTSQTISFTPATTGTVGTPITLEATASSKLAVRFTASPETVCTVKDTTLTLVGAGTCNVKADQAGNTTFSAATQVSKDITVSAAAVLSQQSTLSVVPAKTSLNTSATTTMGSSGGSGTGAVTYAVSDGNCSISGTTLTAQSTAGTCKVTATKAADNSYLAATSAEVSITVSVPAPATPLTFATGYTNTGADTVNYTRAGTSVEGGSFNWYQDSAAGGSDWSLFWWNGISPLTDAVPSFYYGVGLASSTTVPYIGAFVKAPNDGSVTLSGQTKLRIAVWGNDELTSRTVPTFKVFVQAKQSYQSGACFLEAEAPLITPTSIGAKTYELSLSTFTLKNNCTGSGVTTAAEILAMPIGAIHVHVPKANMYFSGSAASANGINLGPISFQP
jgi:hypothetical protein